MLFTTSWDDGYASDLHIAEILEKYKATGTFYVCPQNQHGQAMMTKQQIYKLSTMHEIGAHTMMHSRLAKIDSSTARKDITESKEWVESITKKPCTMFCYPYGNYNQNVKIMLKEVGFIGGRTTVDPEFDVKDFYELPVSLHLYPMPIRPKYTRWWHILDLFGPIRVRWKRLNELEIPIFARRSWQSLARALFLKAHQNNEPFFHLWGHAHELDGFKMWDELESFLAFVAQHDVTHVTNSELVTSLQSSK